MKLDELEKILSEATPIIRPGQECETGDILISHKGHAVWADGKKGAYSGARKILSQSKFDELLELTEKLIAVVKASRALLLARPPYLTQHYNQFCDALTALDT